MIKIYSANFPAPPLRCWAVPCQWDAAGEDQLALVSLMDGVVPVYTL